MKYCKAKKKDDTPMINLEIITISEISQAQKYKYHMILYTYSVETVEW